MLVQELPSGDIVRKVITAPLIVLAALSTYAGVAKGDTVIASNMGPFNSYNLFSSWQISGASNSVNPGEESLGVSFTPTANFTLSQILVPLNGDFPQATNGVEISVDSSVNGLPGASLESWSVSADQAAATLYTLSSNSSIPLKNGTTYWVTASPLADDTFVGWNWSGSDTSLMAANYGAGWSSFDPTSRGCAGCTRSAFAVTGNPVLTPEPSLLSLLATGMLGLILSAVVANIRKRTRIKDSETFAAA